MLTWKKDMFELKAGEFGLFFLCQTFRLHLGQSWWISCIYGPSSNIGKDEVWIEHNDIGNLVDGAWCVGGDFNEFLYLLDRNGRHSSTPK